MSSNKITPAYLRELADRFPQKQIDRRNDLIQNIVVRILNYFTEEADKHGRYFGEYTLTKQKLWDDDYFIGDDVINALKAEGFETAHIHLTGGVEDMITISATW